MRFMFTGNIVSQQQTTDLKIGKIYNVIKKKHGYALIDDVGYHRELIGNELMKNPWGNWARSFKRVDFSEYIKKIYEG